MKTIGLIQARMGSRRLPGKVLREICGKPIVEHIVSRMEKISSLDEILIATGSGWENELLEAWADQRGCRVVRHGNDDDIAGRLASAIRLTGADVMLKANGDCPMLDIDLATEALALFQSIESCDMVTNKIVPSYPLGFSIEVVGSRTVLWCDQCLKDA